MFNLSQEKIDIEIIAKIIDEVYQERLKEEGRDLRKEFRNYDKQVKILAKKSIKSYKELNEEAFKKKIGYKIESLHVGLHSANKKKIDRALINGWWHITI